MTDVGILVEVAMSMRHYDLVETMLKSLPKQIARSASFRERYKAFMLAKWVANNWRTDDPHLVLATLLDNVPSSEADTFIQQAAAQILKTKIKKGMSMAAVNKIIDATFPEENFEETKKKLVDISVEFESPTKVFQLMAERGQDEFKRAVLDLAERMEKSLPTLKVDVEMPQMQPDGEEEEEEVERGEDELTFTAAELREAFEGDWDSVVEQKTGDVQAFVLLRAAGQHTPVSAHKLPGSAKSAAKSTGKGKPAPKSAAKPPAPAAAPSAKKLLPPPAALPPPPPMPVAPAPSSAKRPAVKAEKKPEKKSEKKKQAAAAPAPSPASEGKRHRRFWARSEEMDLVRGVRKYGKGAWKRMLLDEGLTFENRSATDLKDKWRNLEKRREEYERELDAMGSEEEEGEQAMPAAPAARKPSRGGKREAEEMEEVEDSDKERVVKKEPAPKKQQLSPTANQIRESALEARKKRMQQMSGAGNAE